jgi:RNA polymerase sigma factor (sigma-70 family)
VDRHPEDDPTLVRRCLAGDAEAWDTLVTTHRRGMITLARRILPVQDAEDVADAVLADTWERRKLGNYAGRSSLKTWLGAVVINAALNARRAAASRAASAAAASAPPRAPDPPAEHLHAVLRDAVASLEPSAKSLVLLYYEQDLSLDDIGRLLGASKSTLSRALKLARERIRAEADRLARERWGASLISLREGVDLDRLELDLRDACSEPGNNRAGRVSK